MNIRSLPFVSLLIALVAGAAAVLAFAPFGWWPVGILSLAVAFGLVLRAKSVRDSALIGWAYGFGWCVCGVWWLFVSMHRYGGMPAWMVS